MDNRVLVDSDFCNMIASGNNIAKEKAFAKSIFDSLGKVPVIHTFVYNEELLTNGAIKELVEEKYIKIIEYGAFLTENWHKTQYVDDFVDYYDYMNSEAILAEFTEITRHRAKRNMGEIHSLILAHYLGIPVFMSNDSGAKQLVQSRINSSASHIAVKNVCEVFCEIKRNGSVELDKKAVRSILKQRKGWMEAYKES